MKQLGLFDSEVIVNEAEKYQRLPKNIYGKGIIIKPFRQTRETGMTELLPLENYDRILVGYSGGKDCSSVVLYLLELGVPKEKIILLHHCIDGKEKNVSLEMDWPCTEDYCNKFASYLGLEIRYSWREKGFIGEVFRHGASNPVSFEQLKDKSIRTIESPSWKRTVEITKELECLSTDDHNSEILEEELKSLGHRFKFPAKAASLRTRWCSSALKIEVFNTMLRYDDLTERNQKILFVDGIRREESNGRSKYNEMEVHSCSATKKGRFVHTWRPILEWTEEEVWEIIKNWKINPHPCYRLGWNRCSCAMCIFSQPKHFKGIQEIMPNRINQLANLERELNFTIDNNKDIISYMEGACSCLINPDPYLIECAISRELPSDYLISHNWEIPAGAFQGCDGGSL